MGLCGSSLTEEERLAIENSKRLEEEAIRQINAEKEKNKLLLLGAGESGKSTIFKQFKILYGDPPGFQNQDRGDAIEHIHQNTTIFMKALCQGIHTLQLESEIICKEDYEFFMNDIPQEEEVLMPLERAERIKRLWYTDPAIQLCWQRRNEIHIVDSNVKFIEDIDRIADVNYVPNDKDILLSRVRTIGIHEETYIIQGKTFIVIDVGGQRNERRKWIHCFNQVNAVIFVAALSEYDQVLFEDDSVNRMEEAIDLFAQQCNNPNFKDVDMILFLNKMDLFEDKIKDKHIKDIDCFADFDGEEGDVIQGQKYFSKKFLRTKKNDKKDIFVHITTATDTKNIEVVFNTCRTIILKKSLNQAGFLD